MQDITEWLPKWKPVENADLWQTHDAVSTRHDVEWRWVRDHNGDPGNERADALANLGIDILSTR